MAPGLPRSCVGGALYIPTAVRISCRGISPACHSLLLLFPRADLNAASSISSIARHSPCGTCCYRQWPTCRVHRVVHNHCSYIAAQHCTARCTARNERVVCRNGALTQTFLPYSPKQIPRKCLHFFFPARHSVSPANCPPLPRSRAGPAQKKLKQEYIPANRASSGRRRVAVPVLFLVMPRLAGGPARPREPPPWTPPPRRLGLAAQCANTAIDVAVDRVQVRAARAASCAALAPPRRRAAQ